MFKNHVSLPFDNISSKDLVTFDLTNSPWMETEIHPGHSVVWGICFPESLLCRSPIFVDDWSNNSISSSIFEILSHFFFQEFDSNSWNFLIQLTYIYILDIIFWQIKKNLDDYVAIIYGLRGSFNQ